MPAMESLYEVFHDVIKSIQNGSEIYEKMELLYLHSLLEKDEQMQV